MSTTTEPRKVHEGRNLKRIREILQVKQQTLASFLGEDWNQKKVSQLEDKETIDPELLGEVAKALKVTPDAIKNFNDDAAVNIIASNHDGRENSSAVNFQCTFNPIDKWVEALEENKKLYERLLEAEKEKVELLENILNKK